MTDIKPRGTRHQCSWKVGYEVGLEAGRRDTLRQVAEKFAVTGIKLTPDHAQNLSLLYQKICSSLFTDLYREWFDFRYPTSNAKEEEKDYLSILVDIEDELDKILQVKICEILDLIQRYLGSDQVDDRVQLREYKSKDETIDRFIRQIFDMIGEAKNESYYEGYVSGRGGR